ncbi:MAG: NAD(P)H-dependent oxidoreductase [Candidatus Micrarchaeota archaeon]|nr:NAD(P)H-dependent oxidoreductase [Candidatus Micrarchaeota archaeon]
MDLVVFAHPDPAGSHNASLLRYVRSHLQASGKKFEVIDLHADAFSPLMTAPEARAYGRGSADALVKKYQNLVLKADRLVFIYPVWWYGPPAILKGFFDRVFAADFTYNFQKMPAWQQALSPVGQLLSGYEPFYPIFAALMPVAQHLRGKRAVLINTFGGNAIGYYLYGRLPQRGADQAVLEFCGIRPIRRINWFNVRASREGHLGEIPPGVKRQIEQALD